MVYTEYPYNPVEYSDNPVEYSDNPVEPYYPVEYPYYPAEYPYGYTPEERLGQNCVHSIIGVAHCLGSLGWGLPGGAHLSIVGGTGATAQPPLCSFGPGKPGLQFTGPGGSLSTPNLFFLLKDGPLGPPKDVIGYRPTAVGWKPTAVGWRQTTIPVRALLAPKWHMPFRAPTFFFALRTPLHRTHSKM